MTNKIKPLFVDKQISIKSKSKSPNKFKVEKIYLPTGGKTHIITDLNNSAKKSNSHVNLLERSTNKDRPRGKISLPSSMRRINNFNPSVSNSYSRGKGSIDYLNTIRREADMSTNANSNNENTFQAIISAYQQKERLWVKEKHEMQIELKCLREELKAIRIFLCEQDPIEKNIDSQVKDIVPAFIRAWNVPLSDEDEPARSDKKAPKRLVIKKPSISKNEILHQRTPVEQQKKRMVKQFYHPGSLDMSSSPFTDSMGVASTGKNMNDVVINHCKKKIGAHKVISSKAFKGYNQTVNSVKMKR